MALSPRGTLNLETLDGLDPDSALPLDGEQWPPPCEIREALSSSQEPPCLQGFLGEIKAGWGLGDPGATGTWGG